MNVKSCTSFSEKCQASPSHALPHLSPVRHVLVTHAEVGLRLDRFLRGHFPSVPLSFIQRLLRTGQVRVNSGRVRGNVRLVAGDKVRLPPVRLAIPKEEKHPPEHLVQAVRDRIIWQDEHMLVLNKPEGMAVHGGSGDPWGAVDAMRCLVPLKTENCAKHAPTAQTFPNKNHPELCHRLDKGTSGCLLFAMNIEARRQMATAFRNKTVNKKYLALVRGHPRPEIGVIDLPLAKGVVRSGERMVVPASGGSPARTHYQIIARFDHASLLKITLESGRTHQIRVHFQSIGHPLAGDRKYGDPAFNERMKKIGLHRLFLHAQSLAFLHPITQKQMRIKAPLDEKLTKVLQSQHNCQKLGGVCKRCGI